jgi:pseudaminic acid cytidylyltransferase
VRVVAVIPARGGSKRIPRKNIKRLDGKPIIEYSLRACEESRIFDKIHVSTEDSEIAEICGRLGFKPDFFRSVENANDTASIQDVLLEVVNRFEALNEIYNVVCLMSATAPLVQAADLKEAWDVFYRSNKSRPLLAVSKYPAPIEWALQVLDGKEVISPINPDLFVKSSHDFKPAYYDTGTFAFFTKKQILAQDKYLQYIPYIIDSLKGVDVDTMEDWWQIEKLYNQQCGIDNVEI